MAINVSWQTDERQIIYWQIEGIWTLEEFYAAVATTIELSAQISYKAHAIVDASLTTGRPHNNLLPSFRHALTKCDLDTVVYMRKQGGAKFIEILVNIIFRTVPSISVKHFYFAKSIEESQKLIGLPLKIE